MEGGELGPLALTTQAAQPPNSDLPDITQFLSVYMSDENQQHLIAAQQQAAAQQAAAAHQVRLYNIIIFSCLIG